MKEKIVNRLVSVKSIITIILTVVFAVLTILGKADQNFMMIYTVIVSFYFGTQVSHKDAAATPENTITVNWPEGMDPADAAKLAEAALHSAETGGAE